MSYSFGWWDFVEVDGEQQMVCRDSDERVVMVRDLEEPWLAKAIAEHPKRPADRWKRFEYRHEEFWFPLIVNWVPEEGRILVDYNLSSELWRLETNAETEYPPYGGWVRVDDMVPDAFWCWPGILEGYFPEAIEQAKTKDWFDAVMLVGGFSNGSWMNDFINLESLSDHNSPLTFYESEYSWTDLCGKPILDYVNIQKYNQSNYIKKIRIAAIEGHVFERELIQKINASSDHWTFKKGSKLQMQSLSQQGKYVKRDEFDKMLVSGGSRDVAWASYVKPGRHITRIVFADVIHAKEYTGMINELFSKIGLIYFRYSDVPDDICSSSEIWWRDNFHPAALNQLHRECVDAASCFEWENYFDQTSFSRFDACASMSGFLGGVFTKYRCRISKV